MGLWVTDNRITKCEFVIPELRNEISGIWFWVMGNRRQATGDKLTVAYRLLSDALLFT